MVGEGPGGADSIGRRCVVSGRVQGVFFRASTREQAERLGLTGWVRNLEDGRVELRVFGGAEAVDRLCRWLRVGPRHARVSAVRCEPVEYESHDAFRVR